MALDGIMFEGVSVRVRRPNDYNPTAAAALGPSAPNPALNLAAIGLGSARTGGWGAGWPESGARKERGVGGGWRWAMTGQGWEVRGPASMRLVMR